MQNQWCAIDVYGAERCLWRYIVRETGRAFIVAPPALEVDGRPVAGALAHVAPARVPVVLPGGGTEHVYAGRVVGAEGLTLEAVFRLPEDSPVLSFRYQLRGAKAHAPTWYGVSLEGLDRCAEVLPSALEESLRGVWLPEQQVRARSFEDGLCLAGPALAAGDGDHALLLVHQGGSGGPGGSLWYCLAPDRTVALSGASETQAVETPWLQLGAIAGDWASLARHYQAPVL